MPNMAKTNRTRERKLAGATLKVAHTWWGTTQTRKLTFSPPGSNSMTEPGLAGTTMVVSSVFGLERNNCSLHPLQGCYRISGGWGYQRAFQVGCSVRSRWGRVNTAQAACLVLRMQGCRKRRKIGLGWLTPRRQAVIWRPGGPVPRDSRVHEDSRRSNEQRTKALFTEQAMKSDHGVHAAG
jgi:hypothetical protein